MVLTDAQWAVPEPLAEACRPRAKVPPRRKGRKRKSSRKKS